MKQLTFAPVAIVLATLVLVAVVAVVAVVGGGPVAAGGWAVSTLDSVPEPIGGETVEIGFTIRQHGITPTNPGGEIGIVLRSTPGGGRFFPAEPQGDVGHHVAEVTFPDDGTWTWAVRQGWFAEQDLGVIEPVARPDGLAVGGYRWPPWLRFGLPATAVVLAAGAVLDLVRHRRHRLQAVTPLPRGPVTP